MRELIDRQALKDYVSSLSTHPLNEWDTWGVLAAINKQPTVAVYPWHRVESKESLPKESNTYIVYLRQGTKVETPDWMGGEPLSYVVEMEFDREQMLWRADDDAYNAILSFVDTERDFHVTHWTEKPEPPKEDA